MPGPRARRQDGPSGGNAARSFGNVLFAVAFGATAFSAYLTALVPFVMGATCLWCLGSAVTVGSLLWLAAVSGTPRRGGVPVR